MGNVITQRFERAEQTKILQLADLNLKKLPDKSQHVKNMRTLDISNNKLEILNFVPSGGTLVTFNASNNRLMELPKSMSQLVHLANLDVSYNRLTRLTPANVLIDFNQCKNLKKVVLCHNNLMEFPVELCSKNIPIDFLDLSFNQIELVPDSVSPLNASELNLNNNRIKEVTDGIAECPKLLILRLENNMLTLNNLSPKVLSESRVCTLTIGGNRFKESDLQTLDVYKNYEERHQKAQSKRL